MAHVFRRFSLWSPVSKGRNMIEHRCSVDSGVGKLMNGTVQRRKGKEPDTIPEIMLL